MQNRTEKLRAQLRKSTTYLAKIAVVLQGVPDKMLTFPQRDSPSASASKASPLSSVPVSVKQQQPRPTHTRVGTKRSFSWDSEEPLLLQGSAGNSPICSTGGSTHHGLTADRAAKLIKSMHVCTKRSFPVYTRVSAAPYFTSPHSSYITYSVPTFAHDAHHFRL
eukprot:superscaffoldBa00002393_g14108